LTIIYNFSPHGTSASWALMVVRCGLAGYVAGLAAVHNHELLMMGIEVPEIC
jgi:hypothetical protein